MDRIRKGSGAPWEQVVGYSRVVRAGNFVVVTGTTATLPGGAHVDGDAYAQACQCFRNIRGALEQVGASLDDVIRTRMFVTNITRDWELVGRAHKEAVGHVMPATSMLGIKELIAPWMLVEIEADAIVG